MTKKRIATLATCLALVGAVAVGGTLALLTSQTEDLKNTFAVGDGYDVTPGKPDFILQEDIVKQGTNGDYVKDTGLTPDGQNYDNLVSNSTLHKNPFFTLRDANEDGTTPPESWVVAKLDQADIAAMAAQNITFAADSASTGWYLVTATSADEGKTWTYAQAEAGLNAAALNTLQADSTTTKYYFVYNQKLNVTNNATTAPLFTKLSVGAVDSETVNTELDVYGVAVQAIEGSTLEANLNQIVGAAAPLLDAAVKG